MAEGLSIPISETRGIPPGEKVTPLHNTPFFGVKGFDVADAPPPDEKGPLDVDEVMKNMEGSVREGKLKELHVVAENESAEAAKLVAEANTAFNGRIYTEVFGMGDAYEVTETDVTVLEFQVKKALQNYAKEHEISVELIDEAMVLEIKRKLTQQAIGKESQERQSKLYTKMATVLGRRAPLPGDFNEMTNVRNEFHDASLFGDFDGPILFDRDQALSVVTEIDATLYNQLKETPMYLKYDSLRFPKDEDLLSENSVNRLIVLNESMKTNGKNEQLYNQLIGNVEEGSSPEEEGVLLRTLRLKMMVSLNVVEEGQPGWDSVDNMAKLVTVRLELEHHKEVIRYNMSLMGGEPISVILTCVHDYAKKFANAFRDPQHEALTTLIVNDVLTEVATQAQLDQFAKVNDLDLTTISLEKAIDLGLASCIEELGFLAELVGMSHGDGEYFSNQSSKSPVIPGELSGEPGALASSLGGLRKYSNRGEMLEPAQRELIQRLFDIRIIFNNPYYKGVSPEMAAMFRGSISDKKKQTVRGWVEAILASDETAGDSATSLDKYSKIHQGLADSANTFEYFRDSVLASFKDNLRGSVMEKHKILDRPLVKDMVDRAGLLYLAYGLAFKKIDDPPDSTSYVHVVNSIQRDVGDVPFDGIDVAGDLQLNELVALVQDISSFFNEQSYQSQIGKPSKLKDSAVLKQFDEKFTMIIDCLKAYDIEKLPNNVREAIGNIAKKVLLPPRDSGLIN